jgi:hypothetical protein
MPRVKGDKVENNFIKGLVTEKNVLTFPKNAATDTDNCIYDEKGRVYRRPGIDQELGGVEVSYTPIDNEVFTEYLWTSAGGIGSKTFFVQQIGDSLFIRDVSETTVISAATLSLTVDLNDFLPDGSPFIPGEYQCQYSKGNGTLIVTNPVCETFYVDYDYETDTLSTTEITLEERDFQGLEDGVEEYTRQTASVAGITSSNPKFLYNLLNQGWSQSDALSQWDTARTDLPSHRDVVSLFRSSETDAFDDALVTSKSAGTTPAPKGHFIIQPNTPTRANTAALEGYSLDLGELTMFTSGVDYNRTFLSSVLNTNASAIDDGDTTQNHAAATTNGSALAFVGITPGFYYNYPIAVYEFTTPTKVGSVICFGSTDQGFWSNAAYNDTRLYITGGTGSPPTPTDGSITGTAIGFSIITDTSDESAGRAVYNTLATETVFDWITVWIGHKNTSSGNTTFLNFAEVQIFNASSTYQRASTNTFYQGRAWYAGFEAATLSSSIYFSQIIENKNQYGKCYQRQDPTNEYFNELLASDGGVIRILEIEKIVKLFSTQSSVIVLATNGVWEITGNPYFSATNYNVRKMSEVGCFAPLSVVNYKGLPVWWGEDAIYTIQFDPQFQTFQVINMTEDTIKALFLSIDQDNRQYVKGAYDLLEDTIYWLYNSASVLPEEDRYKYTNVLALNRRSIAFYPWSFDGETNYVRGLFYHNPVRKTISNAMKYLYTTSDDDYSYAEFIGYDYLDWGVTNYSSYLFSGYDINETALKHAQPNYVQVYVDLNEYSPTTTFDMTDDIYEYVLTSDNLLTILTILTDVQDAALPSAFIQGVYDFITSDSLQRWSSPQQVYPANLVNRKAGFRRLKVRGKGKSVQFRIYSEEGKPFYIVGWSSAMTGNADV